MPNQYRKRGWENNGGRMSDVERARKNGSVTVMRIAIGYRLTGSPSTGRLKQHTAPGRKVPAASSGKTPSCNHCTRRGSFYVPSPAFNEGARHICNLYPTTFPTQLFTLPLRTSSSRQPGAYWENHTRRSYLMAQGDAVGQLVPIQPPISLPATCSEPPTTRLGNDQSKERRQWRGSP